MLGPGKYDQDATELRKKYKADGIILVVMNGSKGNGFSVQIRSDLLERVDIPGVLRQIVLEERSK